MKKFLLSSLAICFLFAGCSQNYRAEKEFWKAEKILYGIKKSTVQQQGPQAFDPAIEAFKKVYEQYPSTVKAAESLFIISNLYLRQKKYDEALKTLEIVLQNFNDQPDRTAEARYGIAGIHETSGDWKEAEKLFWETAEYHPFHQKGLYSPIHIILHYKRAKNQEGLEQAYAKAIDYYNRMMKQTGPIQAASAIQNYLALAHLSYGNWQEARATWESIAVNFKDSGYAPLALLAAGELSWKKQDYGSAIIDYEKFLSGYPKHNLVKRTYSQLGLVYAGKKDFVKAREYFNKALKDEKDPEVIGDIKLLIGKTYQEEGNWTDAKKSYEEVQTQLKSTNAALQVPFMFASYQEERGNKEEARKILDGAIERYQQLLESSDTRVADYALRLQNAALAEKGDWTKVVRNFDQKIQKEPSPSRKANWIFLKALVTERRLKDNETASKIYADFLQQYPDHPLAALAKSRQNLLLKKSAA